MNQEIFNLIAINGPHTQANAIPGHTHIVNTSSNVIDGENQTVESDRKQKAIARLEKLYRYPAELKLAQYHRQSNKVGQTHNIIDYEKKQRRIPPCPCCQQRLKTYQIPLCQETFLHKPELNAKKLLFPFSISIYFTFVKMVIILLILRFFLMDCYVIYSSIYGNYCAELYNSKGQICAMTTSGYNLKSVKDQNYLNVIDILNLVFTFVSIGYFLGMRKILYQFENYSKTDNFADDDYTILVENIPPFFFDEKTTMDQANYSYRKSIQKQFEQKIKKWKEQIDVKKYLVNQMNSLEKNYVHDIEGKVHKDPQEQKKIVTGVCICYDLNELENINRMREKALRQEMKNNQNEGNLDAMFDDSERLLKDISTRVALLNHEYIRLCQNYTSNQHEISAFKLTHFTGKAFVSFQFEHYKHYFIKQYRQDKDFFKISNQSLKISQASKPNDVYWYNMKVSDSARRKNIVYSWGVLSMLLVLSFAALMGLQFWKLGNATVKVGPTLLARIKAFSISASMSLLTTLINYILSTTMELLSVMEKHKSKSQRLKSLVSKTIVSQTINTLFLYSIIHLIKPSYNILSASGLVFQIMSLIIVSRLTTLLFKIFVPTMLLNRLINYFSIDPSKPIKMFQIQLNKKLEMPQFDFNERYASYVIFTFVVAFYGFLVPLATLILIAIFSMQYWVDKYNLFRRFSAPVDLSFELTQTVLSILETSILLTAVGNFIWQLSVHYDSSTTYRIISIFPVVIALIYTLLSYLTGHSFKKKLLRSQCKPSLQAYTWMFSRESNAKTYFSENPATFCLEDDRNYYYKKIYLDEKNRKELQTLIKKTQKKNNTPGSQSRHLEGVNFDLIKIQKQLETDDENLTRQIKQKRGKINNTRVRGRYNEDPNSSIISDQKQVQKELKRLVLYQKQIKFQLKDIREKIQVNKERQQKINNNELLKKIGNLFNKSLFYDSEINGNDINVSNLQQVNNDLTDEQLLNWQFPEYSEIQTPRYSRQSFPSRLQQS